MKIQKIDLFSFIGTADAICITTNCYVKKDGTAVMGRGVALEAAQRWPELPGILGDKLRTSGGSVYELMIVNNTAILAFPVKLKGAYKPSTEQILPHMRKYFEGKDFVPGYALYADINLIKRSAFQLRYLADMKGWKTIALPMPGCGNGGLKWEDVKPVVEEFFDDRFIIVYK